MQTDYKNNKEYPFKGKQRQNQDYGIAFKILLSCRFEIRF